MPSQVREEAIDLMVALVEAVPIDPTEPLPSYPLPMLRATGQVDSRTMRAVVIENDFLRVTVLPDLGGRILSVFDRRTDAELLPVPTVVQPKEGGLRGLRLELGIELRLAERDRPNAMGRVATSPEPAEDEGDASGVWLAETSHHGGIAVHWHVSLAADAPLVSIEVRAANRTLRALPYDPSIVVPGGNLAVVGGGPRFGGGGWLAPRQADTWTAHLVPLPGGATAASAEAAIYLDDTVVRVQSMAPRVGHKLVLRTEDGKNLESPVDLSPESLTEVSLDGLPTRPTAVALLDPYGQEVLIADREARIEGWALRRPADLDATQPYLERLVFDPARRGSALAVLGARAMAERDWDAADGHLEQALLYNGDDPLTWWALAATRRLRGDEGERPELLNAHFLAPLEPLLRAEAFLGQSPEMGKDPSPVVAPVAEVPEDLVEVACVLIEHGLLDQASRWIDEALRHHDLAMLHVLMADILLRGTRMAAEAAEHLRAAARAQVPPLPWRPIELAALRHVVERFPADEAARRLLMVAERNLGGSGA